MSALITTSPALQIPSSKSTKPDHRMADIRHYSTNGGMLCCSSQPVFIYLVIGCKIDADLRASFHWSVVNDAMIEKLDGTIRKEFIRPEVGFSTQISETIVSIILIKPRNPRLKQTLNKNKGRGGVGVCSGQGKVVSQGRSSDSIQ